MSDSLRETADEATITVTVNGEPRTLSRDTSVRDLLETMDVDPEQSGIAVAVDEEVIPRAEWGDTDLEEGGNVEVITATRGG